jgi:thiamine kinase-like enzyme
MNQDCIKFIDFEYACYSPKSFDIADHFFEYTGYDLDMTLYPSKKTQIVFIKAYLNTEDEKEIENMLKEVDVGFGVKQIFSHKRCATYFGEFGVFFNVKIQKLILILIIMERQ